MEPIIQKCMACGTMEYHQYEYGFCIPCEIDDARHDLMNPRAWIWQGLRPDEHEETRRYLEQDLKELYALRDRLKL